MGAVLLEWRQKLNAGDPALLADARFASEKQVAEAERALNPLIRQLRASSAVYAPGEQVRVWSVGTKRWTRGQVLSVLDADSVINGGKAFDSATMPAGSIQIGYEDGNSRKWVKPENISEHVQRHQKAELSDDNLEKLENIASLAVERDYQAANKVYIELTLGNAKWHNAGKFVWTGCAKAPRGGNKVRRDTPDFLETEEAKEYMFCLKRLVSLSQLIRPNSDVSKHFSF